MSETTRFYIYPIVHLLDGRYLNTSERELRGVEDGLQVKAKPNP